MMKSVRQLLAVMILGGLLVIPFSQAYAQAKAGEPKAKAAKAAPAAPAGAEVEKGTQAENPHASMDFITIVTRAGWFGVVIWVSLISCSIISVALVVDSFIKIRESRIAPRELVDQVRTALDSGDLQTVLKVCDSSHVPLARILKEGFENAEDGFEVVQDAVGVVADLEGEQMLQRVTYLSVISNTTPMLGLIGTVQGMIYAFFTLGTQQAGAAQQALLAVNISHGLWATAVGLGTAVPATIFFFYFKNKAMRIILRMEMTTLKLIKSLRNVEVVSE